MKHYIKIAVLILFIAGIFIFARSLASKTDKVYDRPVAIINDKVIELEVADTPEKRRWGLMQRKHLPENQGMLFVFENPQKAVFWMKDCFISLDIIFLKGNKIVNMYTRVPPCEEEPCELYPSIEFVDKVIEVNAGFADKYNVKINDTVEVRGIKE
jgi:hypothetical protein